MLDPAIGDLPQSIQVVELDAPAIAGNQPLVLKAGEYATHGFLSNAQVIPDVAGDMLRTNSVAEQWR